MFIHEENESDKSFLEKESGLQLILGKSYSKMDMRETWLKGKRYGFEIGLNYSKPQARIEQLSNNIKNQKHKEFYDKFLKLCQEYNVRISYHPREGMMFEQLKRDHTM